MEQETIYAQPSSDHLFIRVLKRCKSFFRVIFVIINNVYCIPTYVVWMMMLYPVKKCHPDLYYRIEGLFFHWLLAMVAMWSWSAGYDIVEMGDDIGVCLEERTLVLANHQSTADVPLLMATFNAKKNVLPHLMWIMDRVFKFTNFGIVSVLHEDFFIVSGKNRREESLQSLAKHLHSSFIPRQRKWIVLFPEGGFLRKRRITSQRYAEKNNLPILKNVSLPRVGALQVIMENLGHVDNVSDSDESESENQKIKSNNGARIRWILDITIAYPQGVPLDLPTIITGSRPPCQTLLFYRLYKSSQIPDGKEEMTNWLYKIFQEKEEMLEKFYATGVFPVKDFCRFPSPNRLIIQDNLSVH
ncbi:conserved hypothetical protein [Pediculus humanus corporis]|uniref:Phospholipid/glycerol acyltransferase domain-containing protein n=1 Tax=Pediculus humanus subsp. corporis TaxID=121224 RepID=E0VIN9_PEDHC|nr:uncharacterized protein Phum_PHUM229910 [Pediculus humanus corporis]EEB13245.1 conserved hypothetical protein [Pediculus humanus corporis]